MSVAYALLGSHLLVLSHQFCLPVQIQLSLYYKWSHFRSMIKNLIWHHLQHCLFSSSPMVLTLICLCTVSPEIVSSIQTFLNFKVAYLSAYWTSPLRYLYFGIFTVGFFFIPKRKTQLLQNLLNYINDSTELITKKNNKFHHHNISFFLSLFIQSIRKYTFVSIFKIYSLNIHLLYPQLLPWEY